MKKTFFLGPRGQRRNVTGATKPWRKKSILGWKIYPNLATYLEVMMSGNRWVCCTWDPAEKVSTVYFCHAVTCGHSRWTYRRILLVLSVINLLLSQKCAASTITCLYRATSQTSFVAIAQKFGEACYQHELDGVCQYNCCRGPRGRHFGRWCLHAYGRL